MPLILDKPRYDLFARPGKQRELRGIGRATQDCNNHDHRQVTKPVHCVVRTRIVYTIKASTHHGNGLASACTYDSDYRRTAIR